MHGNPKINQWSWRINPWFFLDEKPYKAQPNSQLDTINPRLNGTITKHCYNVMPVCMHRLEVEDEEKSRLILWFHQIMNDAWKSIYNFETFRAKRKSSELNFFGKMTKQTGCVDLYIICVDSHVCFKLYVSICIRLCVDRNKSEATSFKMIENVSTWKMDVSTHKIRISAISEMLQYVSTYTMHVSSCVFQRLQASKMSCMCRPGMWMCRHLQ